MKWFTNYIKPKLKMFMSKREDVKNNNWVSCVKCKAVIYIKEIEDNLYTCPYCNDHQYISNINRIKSLLDQYEMISMDHNIEDPINFSDLITYRERLSSAREKTNQYDVTTLASGLLNERKVTILCMDFKFMGGSMGIYVGNSFIQGIEHAIEHNAPYIVFISSGGARMQEGIYSLMQMPRTVYAINKLKQAKIPYIVVWTYPTMGGVSASFGGLGDIVIAEKGALVGFTGRRVIENTIKVQLPEDFQTDLFQLNHGMADIVLHRKNIKDQLDNILQVI